MRDIVKSRIYKQIRSHSQKYFKKLKAHFKITSVYQLYNLEFDYENYNKDMALKDLKLIKKNQDQKVFSNVDKYLLCKQLEREQLESVKKNQKKSHNSNDTQSSIDKNNDSDLYSNNNSEKIIKNSYMHSKMSPKNLIINAKLKNEKLININIEADFVQFFAQSLESLNQNSQIQEHDINLNTNFNNNVNYNNMMLNYNFPCEKLDEVLFEYFLASQTGKELKDYKPYSFKDKFSENLHRNNTRTFNSSHNSYNNFNNCSVEILDFDNQKKLFSNTSNSSIQTSIFPQVIIYIFINIRLTQKTFFQIE